MATMDKVVISARQILKRLKIVATVEFENFSCPESQANIIAAFGFAEELRSDSRRLFSNYLVDEKENELLEEIENLQIEIDSVFLKLKASYVRVQQVLETAKAAPVLNPTVVSAPTSMHSNIKLAPINLMRFDGNLKTWPTFRDLYKVSVHTNPSYSDIEKFHVLITHLSGEPLSIAKSLPISEANYSIIYNTLICRYEDKRLQITTYWRTIANASKVNSDSPQALRALVNCFTENLAALNQIRDSLIDGNDNLGEDPFRNSLDFWDFTLFNWLLQKIDPSTRKRFEIENSTTELPTFDMLKEFVLRQCRALEVDGSTHHVQKTFPRTAQFETFRRGAPHVFPTSAERLEGVCWMCKGGHSINQCPNFLEKSPQERYDIVKDKKICLNCLRSVHLLKDCPSKNVCRKCHVRHHTLLHFEPARRTNSFMQLTNNDTSTSQPSSSSSNL